jgi:hypothetical protein
MPSKTSTTSKTRRTRTAKPKPALNPAAALAAYLKAQATADEVGTVELPKPYVTVNGRVYVHSRHMLAWAKREYGKQITQRDVQQALLRLGLIVRATALPGLGRSVGFYTGVKPKGVSLKGVPVRDRRRGGQGA